MLGKGVIKSQFAKMMDVALAFVITILLTRWMGPNDFGSYSLVLGWIGLASLGVSLGFTEILTRHVPLLKAESVNPSSFFTPLLLLRLGFALLVGIVVKWMAPTLFTGLNHSELLPYVDYIVVLFLLTQAVDLFWAFHIAQLDIGVVFRSQFARQMAIVGAVLLLSRSAGSSLRLVLALVCGAYALGLGVYVLTYRYTRLNSGRKWELNRFALVLKFGLSAWLTAGITFLLSEQSDVLLIGLFTQDTSSVAYYKVGTSLVWKLLGVLTVGAQIVLASLSTLYGRDGEAGLRRGWTTFVKLSTLMVVPSYVLLGWYAPQIITLLYGPEYLTSAHILRIFVALTIVPFGLLGGGLHLMALYTLGREKEGLLIRAVSGLVNLILGVILIRSYGAEGAVVATGLAAIVGIGLEFMILRRFAPQQYPWNFSVKTVLAVMAGALLLIAFPVREWYELMAVTCAYSVVVALVLMWSKPLTAEDCDMIRRVSPRLSVLAVRFRVTSEAGNLRSG